MLYVALSLVAALALVTIAFTSILRWQIRQAARREDLLVNQLCNLAGRPWREAPSQHFEPEPEPELAFVSAPEQLPDY